MIELDGFGKPCPLPLVMMKQELDAGNKEMSLKVDNETAVKNVTRLLSRSGAGYKVEEIEGGFLITTSASISPDQTVELNMAPTTTGGCADCGGYSVFIGKDHVGEGDPELGYNLMKMAIFTLNQADVPPMNLLFMNSGVKLLCEEEPQIIESVQAMMAKGTSVLVCGTCLNFYGIADKLQVGEVSNMYDILERMHDSAKVITL